MANCIPTRERLFEKGIQVENHCVLCGLFGEHLFHIFLDCDFARLFWDIVDIGILGTEKGDFVSWFNLICSMRDGKMFEKVCMLLWGIWHERNEVL